MPTGFDACRKKGGRIRTVKPTKDSYMAICYLGKKSFRGELHHVKDSEGATAEAIKGSK